MLDAIIDWDGEEVRGDGRGPGQVWPKVSVFLETVSQILLTGAVSSVTGGRGYSKRKCALDVHSQQHREDGEQLSFSSSSLSGVLWTIY